MLNDRTIVDVDVVRLVHVTTEHPFHRAYRDEARANWQRELARRPDLFDGLVLLASTVEVTQGALTATCHLVPYSTFLYWRMLRPRRDATHIFAMAVPVASDGAVIAGRMSGWTLNAGLIYCASGSFDASDLADGYFDPERNMAREVMEETGLDLASAVAAPGFRLLPIDGALVIFRPYRFAESSAALIVRAEAHIRSDPEHELDGVVALTDAMSSLPLAAHMLPILASHFAA